MMIATRLLDRDQATLVKLFRQYAEAGERAARSTTGRSTSDKSVIDVETAIAGQTAPSEEASARFEGRVVSFRGRIEEHESIKRFLAELDRLAPSEEQYAEQARAFAADIERPTESKKGNVLPLTGGSPKL